MICDRLRANRELTDTEAADFLRLARAANLYATKGVGRDGRAGDLFLTTLTVHDQGAIVMLVVSGNPEFDSGARRELLAFLRSATQTCARE
jgi:hypothetical protein